MYIQLGLHLTEDLGLKSVTIDQNTTELESDSVLLKNVAVCILKAISLNSKDISLQDLLNRNDIRIG